MSGKRKRDEDEFEFTPPSAKLSKAQKDEGIHKHYWSQSLPKGYTRVKIYHNC
jgi:hypothetical protein